MNNLEKASYIEKIRKMTNGKHSEVELTAEEIDSLSHYLNDPVSTGLWRLNSEWNKNNGISATIWKKIKDEIKEDEFITIISGKRERKIKVTEEWKEKVKLITHNNITFLLTLFSYLASDDEEHANQYSADHEFTQLILDMIETSSIKVEYKEAFDHFKERIWFPGFNPTVIEKKLTRLKSGWIITTQGPRTQTKITMISWSGTALKDLNKFLTLLGKISNSSLMPIFSPEEEVFSPYFDLLENVYPYLVKQEHIKPLFKKSINQFREENYSDCVSAIGLIAEDILTQVYETFFRKQLNKGLTLGQLADDINVNIEALFEKKSDSPPDFSTLYISIKEAINSNEDKSIAALENIRALISLSIESNKFLTSKIDNIGKPKKKNSAFPERVFKAINELIKFRNASSHKSRIPIGPYEATRSIYSLIIFMLWWESEKEAINWEKTTNEIIKESVARNNP